MEIYVDGLAGAVVVSPDKEIERDRSIVMIQSRGQEPTEVEATRCFITLKGPYPHPGRCTGRPSKACPEGLDAFFN